MSVHTSLTTTESPKTSSKLKLKDPRDYDLAFNIALGMPNTQAGLKAGFAKTYVYTGQFANKCSSPYITSIIDHIADQYPDHRRRMAKIRLKRAAFIENTIYDRAEKDVDFAINPTVAKTLERDYKLAGLLHDFSPSQVLVPIQVAIQIQTHIEEQQSKVSQITLDSDDND